MFEVPFVDGSYASTPTILLNFVGGNGSFPSAGLIADAAGNLYGTTQGGGTGDAGTVFELSDAGFFACYLRGTRIATPAGECAIESLEVGDLVLTRRAESLPIAWIGHRRLDCRRHPKSREVWPVRVHVGAFSDGVPHRDLWLSPDHAMLADGVLIPIRYLMNGCTIVQEAADEVTYYHVELASHDVLLAEGFPCESYLDTGNRSAFAATDAVQECQRRMKPPPSTRSPS